MSIFSKQFPEIEYFNKFRKQYLSKFITDVKRKQYTNSKPNKLPRGRAFIRLMKKHIPIHNKLYKYLN